MHSALHTYAESWLPSERRICIVVLHSIVILYFFLNPMYYAYPVPGWCSVRREHATTNIGTLLCPWFDISEAVLMVVTSIACFRVLTSSRLHLHNTQEDMSKPNLSLDENHRDAVPSSASRGKDGALLLPPENSCSHWPEQLPSLLSRFDYGTSRISFQKFKHSSQAFSRCS